MTNFKWISGAALGLGIVLLIAVNMLSESLLTNMRLDLTEHQLYTLTTGTRNILQRLEEPVSLRFYISKDIATKLPVIGPYANRVEELLQEYTRLAQGKLRLEVINPEAFSEAEDQAVSYGIQKIPLADGQISFYFGLVASGPTDERAVIPFMATEREAFLEYDVTKLIHQVAWLKKPVIGILDTLNLSTPTNPMLAMRQPHRTPIILEQIQKAFEVKTIDKAADRIPKEVDVLLLIQPVGLSEATYYAIDQFVLRGGRLLALIDPMPESSNGRPAMVDANLEKLLASWGVSIDLTKAVGDLQLAQQVQYEREGYVHTASYPAWIAVPQELIDNKDMVTANLGSLNLASVGSLVRKTATDEDGANKNNKTNSSANKNAENEIEFQPLITSTTNSMLLNTMGLSMGTDPQMLLQNFQPSGKTYTIAARINGSIKTAYPDGAPAKPTKDTKSTKDTKDDTTATDDEDNSEPLPSHIKASKQTANIILIADTDLLHNKFWVQLQGMLGMSLATPIAANGSLLINALDNLSGDNDLISVRNRGQFSRPFTRISELRQAAEQKYRTKEKELVARLKQAEQRLVALEQGKQNANSSSSKMLNAAQEQEIAKFRDEMIRIRKELRQVRHQLGEDIETLENRIKAFHLIFIPLLIAIIGIIMGIQRAQRRYANSTKSIQEGVA